jgi:hypothetical protein
MKMKSEEPHTRVVALFKIIFLLPKATFRSSLLLQMIPPYVEQLRTVPNNTLSEFTTLEFIPYEELAALLLIFIEKNQKLS